MEHPDGQRPEGIERNGGARPDEKAAPAPVEGGEGAAEVIAPHDKSPDVIGWREYVDLPDWGGARVKAKADTGARSSAIDVANLEEIDGGRVRFEVVFDRSHPDERTEVIAKITRRTHIRSSFGHRHDRLFVRTRIRIGDHEREAEIGLVCRKNMRCRMLLGRTFLEGHFLVDSGRTYVRSKRKASSRSRGGTRADRDGSSAGSKKKKRKRKGSSMSVKKSTPARGAAAKQEDSGKGGSP